MAEARSKSTATATATVEPAEPKQKKKQPEFNIGVDSAPTAEDELVLFLYNPEAAILGTFSNEALIIPVPVSVNDGDGKSGTAFEYKSVKPGLQRIKKSDADSILASEAKAIRALIGRNVLRLWSEETELFNMPQYQAVDAIRLTKARGLLEHWAKSFSRLPVDVQNELEQKEKDMKMTATANTQKFVFGHQVA